MLQHMVQSIVKILNQPCIPIPSRHIILRHRRSRISSTDHRKLVLRDIRVVSPAPELVAVVHGDDEFDAARTGLEHDLIDGL